MPITTQTLNKFKKDHIIYIETGTGSGDSLRKALNIGFISLSSVDISDCIDVRNEMKQHSHVCFFKGSSAILLESILKEIHSPIFIYLDAHMFADPNENLPLLEELAIINKHKIKTHTIAIDDIRLFGNSIKITLEEVKNKILSINKDYKLVLEPDNITNADVLIAYV